MMNIAGAVLCIVVSLAGLFLGMHQRKAEWFFAAAVMALVGGGMVLYLLLIK